MPDLIGVRWKDGQEFDIPTDQLQAAIAKGYTPIESKGPLRGVVDAIGGALGTVRSQLAQQIGGGPDAPLPGGYRSPAAEAVGKFASEAMTDPVTIAQFATGGMGLPARLMIPPAVAGGLSAASGDSPYEIAKKTGVALGSTALGEGTAAAVPWITQRIMDRATQGRLEAASARESGQLSRAMTDVYPEAGPQLQGGTAQEILNLRDPKAGLTAAAGAAKQATEQQIREAFQARSVNSAGGQGVSVTPWADTDLRNLVTLPPELTARQTTISITDLLDWVKEKKAFARSAQEMAEPLKQAEALRDARAGESLARRVIQQKDPALMAAYDKTSRDYDLALRLEEMSGAAVPRPGTESTAIQDTQSLRAFLQKNRGDYPAETYGPIFDAVNLGQGQTVHKLPVPLFLGGGPIRERLPMGLGTVRRPGAPQAPQVPPSVYDLLYGQILNRLGP